MQEPHTWNFILSVSIDNLINHLYYFTVSLLTAYILLLQTEIIWSKEILWCAYLYSASRME